MRRCLVLIVVGAGIVFAQAAKELDTRVGTLRSIPDAERGEMTRKLALEIRGLPAGSDRVSVAQHLAMLSTEGDFGMPALQEAATTLATALASSPDRSINPYVVLAEMARLEHVTVQLDDPKYVAAQQRLQAAAEARAKVDFQLKDLLGKSWKLSELRGKVVVVNHWATWCPPCRKEMPDLDALAREYPQDLVILGLSDEDAPVVSKYLAEHPYRYPILLDEGGKVKAAYGLESIPKSFFYNREGKLVTESIDMRTMRQFRELLAQAGLK